MLLFTLFFAFFSFLVKGVLGVVGVVAHIGVSGVVGNVDARLAVPGVGGTASEVPWVAASVELSGSVGSTYVSRSVEIAIAAATHTTGVKVSIRRTMTPAK